MSCHCIDDKFLGLDEIRTAARENRLLTLEIEFSRKCNFRCPHCYSEEINSRKEMSLEESRDVLLQAKALGAGKIVVIGGEPMIYPEIMEQIRFIRSHGLEIEIITNGSNITESRAKELAELNARIVLKMNTFDRDKQNKFCGRNDAYEIIQHAFSNLTAAGYGKGGKFMAVLSIINKENIDELESLWCWLRQQEIEPYFEIMTPQDRNVENNCSYVDIDRIEMLFSQLAELDRIRFNNTWYPQPPIVGGRCLRHNYSLYVNAYGDVSPCVGITIVIGNIYQDILLKIIQNSEVIQDLRDHRNHIKSLCADCEKIEFCYGCRGTAYQLTGDYLESDPLCWRYRNRKNEIQYLPVSVDNLIPQTRPMQFVDSLICVGDRSATVETEIKKDCPMVDEKGVLGESAYIEIIAQACAAYNGFQKRHKKNGHHGYLIGAKDVKILGQVQVGDHLTITLYKEAKLGDFGVISGRIYRDNQCVAEGEVKVYDAIKEITE